MGKLFDEPGPWKISFSGGLPMITPRILSPADYTRAFMKSIGNAGCKALLGLEDKGANLDALAMGIGRLVEIEGLRVLSGPRNPTRSLKKKLECLKAALACLDESKCDLHLDTRRFLQRSCNQIEIELEDERIIRKRGGPELKTRVAVALVAHVLGRTGKGHWNEVAYLISRAYKERGLRRRCTAGALRQLWKNHKDLRVNWQETLGPKPIFVSTTAEPVAPRYRSVLLSYLIRPVIFRRPL